MRTGRPAHRVDPQNQALAALLFLYERVLERKLGWVDGVTRSKATERLPIVLTRSEVQRLLARLDGPPALVCRLLYGSGLRLFEALDLRVKDIDLEKMRELRIERDIQKKAAAFFAKESA